MTHTSPFRRPHQDLSLDIGVGLRHPHYQDALEDTQSDSPVSFVEIHAENFFAKGGASKQILHDVREKYQLSIHGTSLGLGSDVLVDEVALQKFANLINEYQPGLVSEHICFNRAVIDGKLIHSGDLLPVAFNQQSLDVFASNIQKVQDAIKQPLLLENLSAYLSPADIDSDLKDSFSETEFLTRLCETTGCGLLLDINNMIVNALNASRHNGDVVETPSTSEIVETVVADIQQIPAYLIGEIHVAGFSMQPVHGFIVDDHGAEVSETCWQILERILPNLTDCPILVEWDTNIPPWQELLTQAKRASSIKNARNN